MPNTFCKKDFSSALPAMSDSLTFTLTTLKGLLTSEASTTPTSYLCRVLVKSNKS